MFLFYILLASQACGLFGILPSYIGFFNQSVGCYPVEIIIETFTFLSFAFIITGIYGIKAYRCLDNSRIVLVGLVTLRSLSTAFAVLDITKIKVERNLAGYCSRSPDSTLFLVGSFLAQCVEMFFISGCFFYALWKLHKVPATRGRLSISVTAGSVTGSTKRPDERDRRGWWDLERSGTSGNLERTPRNKGFVAKMKSIWNLGLEPDQPPRKLSLHTDFPLSQPNRTSRTRSMLPGSVYVSRIIPRLRVYAEVLRNELVFTAFITAVQVVVAVPSAIGMYRQNTLLCTYTWISVNWVLLSMLTLHSFRRVVRRHDREEYQQQRAAWDPLNTRERQLFEDHRSGYTRRSRRRHSLSSNINTTTAPSIQDLYLSDTIQIRSRNHAESDFGPRAPSTRTVDSGLARSWKTASVRTAPSLLGVPSNTDLPWRNESMAAFGTYTPSEASSHTPSREGWDPVTPPSRHTNYGDF